MGTRKRKLISAVLITLCVGVIFLSYIFVSALQPPANAGETLLRVDISDMKIGEIQFLDRGADPKTAWRYILHRTDIGEFSVFIVPLTNGLVMMPDLKWWRFGPLCDDFGPTEENGFVQESSEYRCHSTPLDSWYGRENRWSLDGVNLGKRTENMRRIDYAIEGKYIVIGKG